MKKNILFIAVTMLFVSGCASYFKRQECEQINWFKHGEEIAMRGEWLNADSTLNECRKAEAEISESKLDQGFKSGREKYCTSNNSYIVGKSGDAFAKDLCDSPALTSLVSQYNKGLRDYCAKSNGFEAGASGKKYRNLCPADLETSFLPEYKKGRLKYVQAQILNLENRKRDNELAISNKNTQLVTARMGLQNLQNRRTWLESQRSYALGANNQVEAGRIDSEINNLSMDINTAQGNVSRATNEISSFENDQKKISEDIANYRTEMAGL